MKVWFCTDAGIDCCRERKKAPIDRWSFHAKGNCLLFPSGNSFLFVFGKKRWEKKHGYLWYGAGKNTASWSKSERSIWKKSWSFGLEKKSKKSEKKCKKRCWHWDRRCGNITKRPREGGENGRKSYQISQDLRDSGTLKTIQNFETKNDSWFWKEFWLGSR